MTPEPTASELCRRVREEAGTQLTASGSVRVALYVAALENEIDELKGRVAYWQDQADPTP